MQEQDLVIVFKEKGYIPVRDRFSYHAFRSTDIQGRQVRKGAPPVASFPAALLERLSSEQAQAFLERRGSAPQQLPFDTTRVYQVYPFTNDLPEPMLTNISEIQKVLGLRSDRK
jgi:hypothetical protein